MKNTLFYLFLAIIIIDFASCKKDKQDDNNENPPTSTEVLTDFANVLVNPNYIDLQTKADTLNSCIQLLNINTTDVNLERARNEWRNTRAAWELSEAYLFGPVEDFNYDPALDDWPVNKVDMDSLLQSNNPFSQSDIDSLPTSLKGFHPIEYLLFGIVGSKTAADFTSREKEYLVSLSTNLFNIIRTLRESWDITHSGNFTNELIKAGDGSTRYSSRKDALITIVSAMGGICDEVANGKMEEPLIAQDSTLEESQFSHNSLTDFKNNITGVQNAYFSKYISEGKGLNELVASKNLSLDQTIQSQITAAINSLNNISSNYGAAIYTQQVQIHNAQDAINALRNTIDNDLMQFVQTYVTD